MNVQEAREVSTSNRVSIKQRPVWFQPKTLYLLLGMVLMIALVGTCLTTHSKRDANDIVSPFDGSNAPPQTPDRSAIVLPSTPQATPASQGAGAEAASKGPATRKGSR